jgi:hypothetical protein
MSIDRVYYSQLVAAMNNPSAVLAWRAALREFGRRLEAESDSDRWAEIYYDETAENVRLRRELEKMNAARQAAVDRVVSQKRLEENLIIAAESYDQAIANLENTLARNFHAALFDFVVNALLGISVWAAVLSKLH